MFSQYYVLIFRLDTGIKRYIINRCLTPHIPVHASPVKGIRLHKSFFGKHAHVRDRVRETDTPFTSQAIPLLRSHISSPLAVNNMTMSILHILSYLQPGVLESTGKPSQ